MNTKTRLTRLAAVALLGCSGAYASVVAPTAAGGTEALATFVNVAGDSITLDLGVQPFSTPVSGLVAGNYTLPSSVVSFISAAGGAANVQFGLIAGNSVTLQYLTSAASSTFGDDVQIANSAKSLWSSSLTGLVQNVNSGDLTPTSTNLAYGPFAAGSGSPNYIDGGHDVWQSGDFQFSNLAGGLDMLYLYAVAFPAGNTGLSSFTPFGGGLFATLNTATNQLQIQSEVVPAPAAVWLLGTALVPLVRRAMKKARAPA